MTGFERVFVSYHQMQVTTCVDTHSELGIYQAGDDLVHLTGAGDLTVMTGPHTGWVDVRVTVRTAAPADPAGWDAVTETTLWCPEGELSVHGLMGESPEAFRAIAVPGPGLLRVQVRARNRTPEGEEDAGGPAEQYEIVLWPVTTDTGFRTLCADRLSAQPWSAPPAGAAGWAMVHLVTGVDDVLREAVVRRRRTAPHPAFVPRVPGRSTAPEPRVAVRRSRTLPAARAAAIVADPDGALGLRDLRLSAGPLTARLGTGTTVSEWRWENAAGPVPDEVPGSVELTVESVPGRSDGELTVHHRGVRGGDAIPLGLIWDHLLDRASTGSETPHPWERTLAELAAEVAEAHAAAVRRRERAEAKEWGGRPPTDRLRALRSNARGLANYDRDLVDVIAAADPGLQRDIARWAARRACAISGLDTVGWIAAGLSSLERGEQPFEDEAATWDRLWSDPRAPRTVVTSPPSPVRPQGTPNFSQQAMALPAVFAAAHEDPLAAAFDALWAAAGASGFDGYQPFLTSVRVAFPALTGD
ncbi:hypothetical protein [Cryptosporangium aurantiacum]|uniref:Uncharacterized protein n=1 Tax=Cryptosporangium aurantiacum TaxID=134849 RepID=A0A1M7RGN2_9ACTN|nr:hypothetical protein [Cryptosporangium aurantiacum]SHN45299.1 hypothetical protein SAMN05443668_111241 [Cryptosporangium aurantiacum]